MTDRLDRFKTHIQRKLEDDIDRVGELAQWCKQWPQRAGEMATEQQELDKSIPELRTTLAYLDDFEREERAAALGLTPQSLAMIEGMRSEIKSLQARLDQPD